MHLNGQNLKLAAKNGRAFKTPGHHLSASQGKDPPPTRKAAPLPPALQLDLLLATQGPRLDRGVENERLRRPAALAPLELPEKVREAQRQKLKLWTESENRAASCKVGASANPDTLKKSARSCARQRAPKPPACPDASAEPLKSRNRSPKPRLRRCEPTRPDQDWSLEGVVCRGTPAPLHNKPPSLLPSLRVRAAGGGGGGGRQSPEEGQRSSSPSLLEAGGRRRRLRRAQRLEGDQHPGLAEKLCQGVRAKGQGHADKGVQQPATQPWEPAGVRRGRVTGGGPRPMKVTLRRQSAEGGSGDDPARRGVKSRAPHWGARGVKNAADSHSAEPLAPPAVIGS